MEEWSEYIKKCEVEADTILGRNLAFEVREYFLNHLSATCVTSIFGRNLTPRFRYSAAFVEDI